MSRSSWKNYALLLAAHAVTALQNPPGVLLRPVVSSARQMSMAPDFSDGFDSLEMDALVQRSELEASLMQAAQMVLEEPTKKSSKKKKHSGRRKGPSAAMISRTLKQDGVVRLNGVLSAQTAAALRADILERRAQAYTAIEDGDDWHQYFADVLLKSNRCDLLLPLKGSRGVQTALRELLEGSTSVSNALLSLLGDDATLYELAALISEPGSPRQPVHPDNPHQVHPPLLTCFVALQDIRSSMGPTTFLPKTNTAAAHTEFNDISQRDTMLAERPSVVALLKAGDASLFDSRTIHCGGANDVDEGATRALFYFSFRNPCATLPIGNVGSIIPDIKPITLRELRTKLAALGNDDTSFDPFDEGEEEAVAVREYIAAAKEGNADAQFNLGLCYRRGEGVEKNEVEAFRWFQLSAEQGGAVAQCNLGSSYYLGEGVEKNDTEAVCWFEKAASQGLAHAQHNLGFCYFRGVGVSRNPIRAAELFHLAAEQGHPGAQAAYDEPSSDSYVNEQFLLKESHNQNLRTTRV